MQIWGMEHESSIELSPEDRARLLDRVRPENSRKGRKGAKSVRVTALGQVHKTVEAGPRAQALKSYVRTHARQATVMLPTAADRGSRRDEGWKLDINADVKAEQ
jgi:hypothetical protein